MPSNALCGVSTAAACSQLIDFAPNFTPPTLPHMSTAFVRWKCSKCDAALTERQPQHKPCHAATKWQCVWSEASGMYKNYKRHAEHCPHCSPGRLRQIAAAERADKENRLSATAETESSQNADTPPPRHVVDS